MKKTDKKLDNTIRRALTQACEVALKEHDGFKWLTHFVDYARFPESLSILCVFDSDEKLAIADKDGMSAIIVNKLFDAGITLEDYRKKIRFNTEESCSRDNGGKWKRTLH